MASLPSASSPTLWGTAYNEYLEVEHAADGTHSDITSDSFITKDPWFDVRAFGATGDGSTNDTAAIQAAIDAATTANVGTGTVYIPVGTYMISNLTLPPVITVRGESMWHSILKRITGSTGNAIQEDSTIQNATKIQLYDFTIQGNATAGIGINLGNESGQWGTQGFLNNLLVRDFTGAGGTGFDLNANAAHVGNISVLNCTTIGVLLRGAGNVVESIDITGTSTIATGLKVTSSENIINTAYFEGKFTLPVDVDGSNNLFRAISISVEAATTITNLIDIDAAKFGNNFLSILNGSAGTITNLVDDNYLGETITFKGGTNTQSTYFQGSRWNHNVIPITGNLTIPSTSVLDCVVAGGLGGLATVTLPRLSGCSLQQISIFNADSTFEVLVAKSGADGAALIAGNQDALYIPPRRSVTLRCDKTEWAYIAGDVGRKEALVTLADDATPTIRGGKLFLTGGVTTITDFDDGQTGQIITVIAEHSLVITDGTNIFLNGSANFSMTATDTLTLIQKADGKWYEVSRGDNGA